MSFSETTAKASSVTEVFEALTKSYVEQLNEPAVLFMLVASIVTATSFLSMNFTSLMVSIVFTPSP